MKLYDRFRKGNENGADVRMNDNLDLAQQTSRAERSAVPDYGDENDDNEPGDYSNQMFPSNYLMQPVDSNEDESREEHFRRGIGALPAPLAEDPTVQGSNVSEVHAQNETQDKTNNVEPSSVGMSHSPYDHTLTRSRRSTASTYRRREMIRREEERKFKRTLCLVIAAIVAWCILAAVVGGIVGALL